LDFAAETPPHRIVLQPACRSQSMGQTAIVGRRERPRVHFLESALFVVPNVALPPTRGAAKMDFSLMGERDAVLHLWRLF
jgi:hypothetical protein